MAAHYICYPYDYSELSPIKSYIILYYNLNRGREAHLIKYPCSAATPRFWHEEKKCSKGTNHPTGE